MRCERKQHSKMQRVYIAILVLLTIKPFSWNLFPCFSFWRLNVKGSGLGVVFFFSFVSLLYLSLWKITIANDFKWMGEISLFVYFMELHLQTLQTVSKIKNVIIIHPTDIPKMLTDFCASSSHKLHLFVCVACRLLACWLNFVDGTQSRLFDFMAHCTHSTCSVAYFACKTLP